MNSYNFSLAKTNVFKVIVSIVVVSLMGASLILSPVVSAQTQIKSYGSQLPNHSSACGRSHTLVWGDTVWGMSRAYNVTMNSIVACNGWTDGIYHLLIPGKKVLIPSVVANTSPPTVAPLPAPALPAPQTAIYTHPNPNVERWHATAIQAGWTEAEWRSVSCIMQHPVWTNVAESSGLPHLHVQRGRDNSYGLMMLNTYGSLWSWYKGQGLTSRDQLLDPYTNLYMAKLLSNLTAGARWGNHDKWYPWRSTSKRNTCFT